MSRLAWILGVVCYWVPGRYHNPFKSGTRRASAFYAGYASWCPVFHQRYQDWKAAEHEAKAMEARFRFQ